MKMSPMNGSQESACTTKATKRFTPSRKSTGLDVTMICSPGRTGPLRLCLLTKGAKHKAKCAGVDRTGKEVSGRRCSRNAISSGRSIPVSINQARNRLGTQQGGRGHLPGQALARAARRRDPRVRSAARELSSACAAGGRTSSLTSVQSTGSRRTAARRRGSAPKCRSAGSRQAAARVA